MVMRCLRCSLAVVAIFWLVPAPAWAGWPDGVLNYCGFEGFWDEAGWRDLGWAQGGTEGIRFDRLTKKVGKASLRIDGAADQKRAVLQLNGNAVQGGKRYVLRAWIKTENIAGEAAIALQPHEEGKPLGFFDLGQASRLAGTHDWTLVEVPVPPIPDKVVRVFPYLWVTGAGTAWFDEFALTEAGVPVPPGGQREVTDADFAGARFDDAALPKNLLQNPGFEQGLDHWYVECGKPQIDQKTAAGGSRSLRLDGFSQCAYTVVQVRVKIDPRRAYRLGFRLKTDLRAGLSCARLIGLKASGEPIAYFGQDHSSEFCYGRGTEDWHDVSVVLRAFEPQTDAVNVYLELQDAIGTVWIDDVRLAPLSLEETKRVRGP
jgi:hypothetical protein